jgi:hypothetical protein
MAIRNLGVLFILFGLCACARGPTITVRNNSATELENVVLSGTGFTKDLGKIAAGAQQKLTIHLNGDSGINLGFNSGSQHFQAENTHRFVTGEKYFVIFDVASDHSVTSRIVLPGM